MKFFYTWMLLLMAGAAFGEVFPDNEARRAILDLRTELKRVSEETKKSEEALTKSVNLTKVDVVDAKDQIDRIKSIQFEQNKLLNNLIIELDKNKSQLQNLKSENTKLEQAILELKSEIETLKIK